MWPKLYPRLKGDMRTIGEIGYEEKVPEEEEDLHTWAKVMSNPAPLDRARRWSLVTVMPPEQGRRRVVAICVQGFVEANRLKIGALGNWDRK